MISACVGFWKSVLLGSLGVWRKHAQQQRTREKDQPLSSSVKKLIILLGILEVGEFRA